MSAAPSLALALPDAEAGGLPPAEQDDGSPALAVIVTPPAERGGKNVLVQGPPGMPVEPMSRELRAMLRAKAQAGVPEDEAVITMEDEDPTPAAARVADYIAVDQARALLLESRADLAEVISHFKSAMATMTSDFQRERDELETRWRGIVAAIVTSSSERAENLQVKADEATSELRALQASTAARIATLENELAATFAKHDALVAASAAETAAHQSQVAALESRHAAAVKDARDVATSASVVSQWRLTMQRRALLSHVADRDAALEDLENDRRKLTRAVVELHVARDALASQLEQAEVLNAQLRAASDGAAKQLEEMQAAITTAQSSATAEMAAAEGEIASLRAQVAGLQAALEGAGASAADGATAAAHAALVARVGELETALAAAKAGAASDATAATPVQGASSAGADAAALYASLIGTQGAGQTAEAGEVGQAAGVAEATPAALAAVQARAIAAEARVAALSQEVATLQARLAELAARGPEAAAEGAGDGGEEALGGEAADSSSSEDEGDHGDEEGKDGSGSDASDGEAVATRSGGGAGSAAAGDAAGSERAARGAGSLAASAKAGNATTATAAAATGGAARDAAKVKEQDKVIKELRTKIRALEAAAAKAAGAKGAAGGGGIDEKALQQQLEKQKATLEKKAKKEREDLEKEHKKETDALTRRLTKATTDLAAAQAELETVTKERDDLRRRLQLLGDIEKEIEAMRGQVEDGKKARAELEAATARVAELDKLYKDEQTLRKKYWNMMEDMKGKIRVYCRSRPMSDSELERGNYSVVAFPDPMTIELDLGPPKGRKQFVYDAVFGPDSTQDQISADTENLIQSAFDGYNVSIFAYGQTGSGKTFTMVGSKDHPGVTPRAVTRLYQLIEKAQSICDITVQAYMVELYLDNLIDLFWRVDNPRGEPPKLEIKKDEKGLVVIRGAVMRDCPTAAATMEAFEAGNAVRHVGSTAMNATSSRSHLIFALLINTYNRQTKKTTTGKLSLIDLAGSERASKTGATAERLKEAQAINKSLSALGNVISALSSNEKAFIPYRDNKLTQLMSDSLGGNAKTLMFVNLSPADYNVDETQTSLVYASRVKLITNSAEKMQESAEVARLKKIIAQLRAGNTAAAAEADAVQSLDVEEGGGPDVDDEGRPIGGGGDGEETGGGAGGEE